MPFVRNTDLDNSFENVQRDCGNSQRPRSPLGDTVLFALDDTPTKRVGPLVDGAGIHYNPTPGPAAQKFLYGHLVRRALKLVA